MPGTLPAPAHLFDPHGPSKKRSHRDMRISSWDARERNVWLKAVHVRHPVT